MTEIDHLKKFASSFLPKSQERRILSLLETNSGVYKIRMMLSHSLRLDPVYCKVITPNDQTCEFIVHQLSKISREKKCYVFSENSDLDGQYSVEIAIDKVFCSGFASIISVEAGKVAYYEGEEPNERYICNKTLAGYRS